MAHEVDIVEKKEPAHKKYVLKKRAPLKTDYKVNYEQDLNEKQLEAVMSNEGALLVIAGAGSGKTKTLTYRVARLIEDGIPPQNILLLTFTKKAAKEMLNRASIVLDERCDKVAGGTFHSFSNMILRKYANLLGLKNKKKSEEKKDEDIKTLNKEGKQIEEKKTKTKKAKKENVVKNLDDIMNKLNLKYIEPPKVEKIVEPPPEEENVEEEETTKDKNKKGKDTNSTKGKNVKDDKNKTTNKSNKK